MKLSITNPLGLIAFAENEDLETVEVEVSPDGKKLSFVFHDMETDNRVAIILPIELIPAELQITRQPRITAPTIL